ncbi:MAG: rod shape-determining protein MreD [Deltaproteobacteria bacterium]|nr:rod shape-determining protein MreD [Deltaproteobacteria bacterium]
MKEFILFIPLTIIYWSFKSTVLPGFPLPDLSLVLVFYLATKRNTLGGVILAFVLGFIDDSFSSALLGTSSFALILVYLLVQVLMQKMHFTRAPIIAMGAFALTLFKGSVMWVLLYYSGISISYFYVFVPTAVTTALFTPALTSLIEVMQRVKLPRSGRENIR